MSSSIPKLYAKLEGKRSPYLTRARASAALTIPSLFPEEGTKGEDYLVPYQGDGARGVKSLAAKLLLTLFPPNSSFFQMTIDAAEVAVDIPEATKGDIEQGLRVIESMVNSRVEQKAMRTSLYEVFKQLLVGGNTLIHIGKERLKVYRLDKYVLTRDSEGAVSRLIIKEQVDKIDLPADIAALVGDLDEEGCPKDIVNAYTVIIKQPNGRYKAHQEIMGNVLEGSESSYKADALPWLPLRMIITDSEDYGRAYVEEHMGDLQGLEALSKVIREGSMAAARILFLVRPNSSTKIKTLRDARNGDFVSGTPDDIKALQLDKYGDFKVASDEADKMRHAIAQSFMMTQSIQRNAERVTAEEIRTLANEIEANLGGVYPLLAQELQAPMVRLLIARLVSEGKVQQLPKGIVPKILTGVAGMGRTTELGKLSTFLNYLQPLGQEVVSEELNTAEYIKRLANATDLDIKGLTRTEEQKQERQEQRMMEQSAPQVAGQMAQ